MHLISILLWFQDRDLNQMNFANAKDQSLLAFYESVRRQVEADKSARCRLVGDTAREYAERLLEEMVRRRLSFTPIEWPAQ
jgi:hypothetical protein